MHENIGYIKELNAGCCCKGLIHNVLGPNDVNLYMYVLLSCSLLDTNVLSETFIVHHGDYLL